MDNKVQDMLDEMESAIIGLIEERKLCGLMYRYFENPNISDLKKVDAYDCVEVLIQFLLNELVDNLEELCTNFYALWDYLKENYEGQERQKAD